MIRPDLFILFLLDEHINGDRNRARLQFIARVFFEKMRRLNKARVTECLFGGDEFIRNRQQGFAVANE